jgi:predicted permease
MNTIIKTAMYVVGAPILSLIGWFGLQWLSLSWILGTIILLTVYFTPISYFNSKYEYELENEKKDLGRTFLFSAILYVVSIYWILFVSYALFPQQKLWSFDGREKRGVSGCGCGNSLLLLPTTMMMDPFDFPHTSSSSSSCRKIS